MTTETSEGSSVAARAGAAEEPATSTQFSRHSVF